MKNILTILFFLLLSAQALYPQHCGSLVLTCPASVKANQVWPLQVSWNGLTAAEDVIIDVQISDHFTLLSTPAPGIVDSGRITLMILSSPFTPAKEYTIKITLKGACEITNELTESICVQLLPVPKAEALLLDTQSDSLSFYLTNNGNATLRYGSAIVLPGDHLKSTVARSQLVQQRLTLKVHSLHGWDTTITLFSKVKTYPSIVAVAPPGMRKPWARWNYQATWGNTFSSLGTLAAVQPNYSVNLQLWNTRVRGQGKILGDWGYFSAGNAVVQTHDLERPYKSSFINTSINLHSFAAVVKMLQHSQLIGLGWKEGAHFHQARIHRTDGLIRLGLQSSYAKGANSINLQLIDQSGQLHYQRTKDNHFLAISAAYISDSERSRSPVKSYLRAHSSGQRGALSWSGQSSLFESTPGPWNHYHTLQTDLKLQRWLCSFQATITRTENTTEKYLLKTAYTARNWTAQSSIERRLALFQNSQYLVQHNIYYRPSRIYLQAGLRQNISTGVWSVQSTGSYQAMGFSMGWQGSLLQRTSHSEPHFIGGLQIGRKIATGTLRLLLQNTRRASLAWSGELHKDSGLKELKGRCVDQNNAPISGVLLSIEGKTVQSSANGDFEFQALKGENAHIDIQASSLPFATAPKEGFSVHRPLVKRSQKTVLFFEQSHGITGQLIVAYSSPVALRSNVVFQQYHLVLYHDSGDHFTAPILPDGRFALGGLPCGRYKGAIHPLPQGFSYENIAFEVSSGASRELTICFNEVKQNIPFQAL